MFVKLRNKHKFLVTLLIKGKEVSVEVDSGAYCSIVSEATFRAIEGRQGKIPLQEYWRSASRMNERY